MCPVAEVMRQILRSARAQSSHFDADRRVSAHAPENPEIHAGFVKHFFAFAMH